MITESQKCRGDVQVIIDFIDQKKEVIEFRNTILQAGREALALSLANRTGDDFDFFVNRMLFGDGGTTGGVPKVVNADRTGLFGTTRISKPVVANIDPNSNSQVIFTSVVSFDEGNNFTLNEMALQMHGPVPSGGQLYSMATFPGITKTAEMQITFNWRLSFI